MLNKMHDPWPRREHFRHYMDNVRCTYSFTVNIDISGLRRTLKSNGLKAYPAQIYMLATGVNHFPEFRMALSGSGKPGYWESSHPSYTVFNPEAKTFSSIWTGYQSQFSSFYRDCAKCLERYSASTVFEPQRDMPPNLFTVSSIPWLDFTAFNLNVYADGTYLSPIFTIGKYIEQGGKTLMPLAVQLHHAACDGYHAGQFVELVRNMAQEYQGWL